MTKNRNARIAALILAALLSMFLLPLAAFADGGDYYAYVTQFSQRLTDWKDTPSCSANCSCVRFLAFRRVRMLFPRYSFIGYSPFLFQAPVSIV